MDDKQIKAQQARLEYINEAIEYLLKTKSSSITIDIAKCLLEIIFGHDPKIFYPKEEKQDAVIISCATSGGNGAFVIEEPGQPALEEFLLQKKKPVEDLDCIYWALVSFLNLKNQTSFPVYIHIPNMDLVCQLNYIGEVENPSEQEQNLIGLLYHAQIDAYFFYRTQNSSIGMNRVHKLLSENS